MKKITGFLIALIMIFSASVVPMTFNPFIKTVNASTILPTPTGLISTAKTHNSVTLSWIAVTGATSYEITYSWRGATGARSYMNNDDLFGSETVTSTTNEMVVTGLWDNTTFTFTVIAKSATGSSNSSTPLAITTNLTAPYSFALADTTSTSVSLSWSSVSGATSYEINYGGTTITSTTNSKVITGLTANTTYNFKVKGVNATADGDWSVSLTVTTLTESTLPAPINLASTAKTNNSVTLSWSAVSGATNYEINYGGTTITSTTNSKVITGLTANTAYTFKVKGENATTDGNWSTPLAVSTLLPTPIGLAFASKTYYSVNLSWTAISGATSYDIKYGGTTVTSTTNLKVVTGLSPSTAYAFTVTARNATNTSAPSTALSVTTSASPLAEVTNFTSTAVTSNSISLSWKSVKNAIGYEISYNGNTISTTSTSTTLSNLTPSTAYTLNIRTKDANGFGSWLTTSLTVTTSAASTLSVPTGLISTAKTHNTVTLSWNAVSGATSYEIKYGSTTLTSGTTSLTVTGLTPSTIYLFSVRAISATAASAWSSGVSVTTDAAPLAVPTGLTSPAKTHNTVTLSWNAVSGATSYEIKYGSTTLTSGTTSLVVTGLTPSTLYSFTIRAISATAASAWSSGVSVTTNAAPLAVPAGLTSTAKTHNTVTLSWNAVSGATSYEIKYGSTTLTSIGTSLVVTGLTPSTLYSFSVRAISATVASAWSSGVSVTTNAAPLAVPAGLTSTAKTHNTVTLSWNAVSGATNYEIKYGSTTLTSTGTSLVVTGLTSSTLYSFSVRAISATVASAWSSGLSVTTDAAPLAVPTGLISTAKTHNTVTLSWNAVSGATSYEIKYGSTTLTSTGTSLVVTGLTSSTLYSFSVRAISATAASAWSSGLSVTTNAAPLAVPAGLTSTAKTHNTVTLSWNAVSGATNYEIKYGSTTLTSGTTSLVVTGLTPSTIYLFSVRAKSATLTSAWSSELSLTTNAAPALPKVEYNITATSGNEYLLVLTNENISTFNGVVFTLTYDTTKLSLIDFAAHTQEINTATGEITDTDIEIISNLNGVVKFSINKTVPSGKYWSGTLSVVKFKALSTSSSVIKLEK